MNAINLFPISIYREKLDLPISEKENLINYILDYNLKQENRGNDSIENVSTSYHENNQLFNLPQFEFLTNLMMSAAYQYAEDINFDIDRYFLYISSMWFQYYAENESMPQHNHGTSLVSASYYLQIPKNSAALIFWNPIHQALREYPRKIDHNNSIRYADNNLYHINPEEDEIVLFPGYLDHGTSKHKSIEPRIIISANWKWAEKRKIGE